MSKSVLLQDDQPIDPDDELLVAYLDGELSDRDRKQVEDRLIQDDSFKSRLQSLEAGWGWLDELPDVSPSEKLVESTIELVVADIAPAKPEEKASWLARHPRRVAIAVLSFVALLLGAGFVAMARHVSLRQDLKDLAVAENIEAYRIGQDFDFLRALDSDPQWRAMLEAMDVAGQTMTRPSLLADVEPNERKAFIRDLPLAERVKLETRWEQFLGFDEAEKARVRQTAEAVAVQADGERLLNTMQAFSLWRESLDDDLKDELGQADDKERLKVVRRGVSQSMNRLRLRSGSMISEETADMIYLLLQHMLKKRLQESEVLEANYQRSIEISDEERASWFWAYVMVHGRSPFGRFGGFGGGFRPGGPPGRPPRPAGERPEMVGPPRDAAGGPRPDGSRPDPPERRNPFPTPALVSDRELIELTYLLGDDAIDQLDALTNDLGNPVEREQTLLLTLRLWAIETLHRKRPTERDDRSTLERYLELDQREEVDLLSPDEILQRLSDDPRSFDRSRRPPRSRP